MLEQAELNPAVVKADQAVARAVAARLALGPVAADLRARSLRPLLAPLDAAAAAAAAVQAVLGRIEAAARGAPAVFGPAAMILASDRFGAAVRPATAPETALSETTRGGWAVIDIAPGPAWWGRLLATPGVRVVGALPDGAQTIPRALVVSAEACGPTGDDRTFWITDSAWPDARIVGWLAEAGLAADLLTSAGGLKLFVLAGYVQADDPRLSGAPGSLSGVIGAAPVF